MTKDSGAYMKGKDILLLPDGSTYHLGAKKGDIYPRLITVGSPQRAAQLSKLLDTVEKTLESSRQFHIYSGKYKGVGISIVAIGMGSPMMDFFVRESSFVCAEPMAIIRIGTCGIFNPELPPGTVICAGKGCACSYINHVALAGGHMDGRPSPTKDVYCVTRPVQGDAELNQSLLENLEKNGAKAYNGLNVAADTFFSCQGRQDSHFDNHDNSVIMESFAKAGVDSCEMESYTLFQLARQRTVAPLKTAACHIGILNRVNEKMETNINSDELVTITDVCGRAALDALVSCRL